MKKTTIILGLLLGIALAAAAASCQGEPPVPLEDPHIRGAVEGISDSVSDSGILGFILISGELQPDTSYDRALVTVTRDTQIYKEQNGRRLKARYDEITYGCLLEVWFSGPAAESYPVQAEAGAILILTPLP